MRKIQILITVLVCLFALLPVVHAYTNQQVMQEENQEKATKLSERNGILLDVARTNQNDKTRN